MDKKYINNNNLVYDLGMHNGDDTDYYLHKGYRVIAVDPVSYTHLDVYKRQANICTVLVHLITCSEIARRNTIRMK